jgi:hypothetical protein
MYEFGITRDEHGICSLRKAQTVRSHRFSIGLLHSFTHLAVPLESYATCTQRNFPRDSY